MTRPRDSQRSRVYAAEGALHIWGQTIPDEDLQGYVDRLLDRRPIRSRWGNVKITVERGRGGGRAWPSLHRIRLGVNGRNPYVVAHEVAHVLTGTCGPFAGHGPEFAGVYLFIVEHGLQEPDKAEVLRAAFREHRVKVNRAAIPEVRETLPPSAATRAAAKRAAARTPITGHEVRTAVRLLRQAIAAGQMGPRGSASRKAALATAKRLEAIEPARDVAA
jgi:hypothetical protein